MGQSNMSGFNDDYDAAIDGPNDDRIQQWTRANNITTASEHLEHANFIEATDTNTDTRVGPGTAFGRAYVKNLPEFRNVLLVPTAKGGTSLVNGPWIPGGYLFEDAVTRMKAALANDEPGNCVAAILWHQGEADGLNSVSQETYESSWIYMISELRERIPAAAEAPVILGEYTPDILEIRDNLGPILGAIRAIPDYVAKTAVAPSDGLPSMDGESVHFTAAGQREYGQRYYDKLGEAVRNE